MTVTLWTLDLLMVNANNGVLANDTAYDEKPPLSVFQFPPELL